MLGAGLSRKEAINEGVAQGVFKNGISGGGGGVTQCGCQWPGRGPGGKMVGALVREKDDRRTGWERKGVNKGGWGGGGDRQRDAFLDQKIEAKPGKCL
eukprot:762786-Hanusia_phi.AAC.1